MPKKEIETTNPTITAVVKLGEYKGQVMVPHVDGEGFYVASMTNRAVDYVQVPNLHQLMILSKAGFSVHMSIPGVTRARSMITNESLTVTY